MREKDADGGSFLLKAQAAVQIAHMHGVRMLPKQLQGEAELPFFPTLQEWKVAYGCFDACYRWHRSTKAEGHQIG